MKKSFVERKKGEKTKEKKSEKEGKGGQEKRRKCGHAFAYTVSKDPAN